MPVRFSFLFIALFASLLSLFIGESHAEGPFDNMRGSWSGVGTITLTNGGQERIRCRASYSPSGPNLRMTLVCASDSYKVDLASQIDSRGDQIRGSGERPRVRSMATSKAPFPAATFRWR